MGFEAGKPTSVKVKAHTRKAPTPRKSSAKQVTQARAQEQQYASQGVAVKKAAAQQRRVRVRAKQLAKSKPLAGDAPQARAKDTQRAQAYVKGQYVKQAATEKAQGIVRAKQVNAPYKAGTTVPPDVAAQVKYQGAVAAHKASVVGKVAPVLTVLNQTTRPLHAIAGAANEDVKTIKTKGVGYYLQHGGGGAARHAAARGIQNKDHTTFSTVLTTAGWKPKGTLGKVAKGAAAFTADMVADPTTYATGGTGSIAEKAAADAAKSATKKAVKAGLTGEQAARFGERAAKQAADKAAPKGSGVTLKLAGQEVPGVRKASAAAGRGGGKAFKRVAPQRVRNATRSAAGDVNPNIAPVGVPRAVHQAEVTATRTARAQTTQGERHAIDVANGIKKQIGEKNYRAIVDAIESRNIGSLPEGLRAHAVTLRSELRHIRKVQRRSGIAVGEVGHRPQIDVPQVTANVEQSAKDIAKARRREMAARRELEALRLEHGIAQGRAEVLSRNVSGVKAERAASRAVKLRTMAGSRAGQKGSARDVLRYMDRVESGQKYAGGGHGVSLAQSAIHDAESRLSAATAARQAAEASHESTKVARVAQGAHQQRVLKINAKRAKATSGYVPRGLTPEALVAKEAKAARPGRASLKPKSSKGRVETRPMSQVRADKPGKYREDLHALVGERIAEGHASAALAQLNQRLGDLGTAVKRGTRPAVQKGEAVFHIKAGQAPRKVPDDELARATAPLVLNKAGTKVKNATRKSVGAGRYVVLNEDVVKRAVEGANPVMGGADKGIIRGLDKTTGGFKRLALATPGFHLRNFAGDLSQAYIKQPGQKLAGNLIRARRVTHALGAQEKAARKLGQPAASGKTLHLPQYGHVSYEDIAHNLVNTGAARSGYTSRELRELSKSGNEGALRISRPKAPASGKRLLLNREDIPRLATAINALRNGATWEQAAQKVADTHFDYGHLTKFERNVARRLMPFYTWSARNIPFQAKAIVSNPGKYAAYQKLREEAATATQPGQVDPKTRDMYAQLEKAGVKLPGGWEKYLSEYEQRNAGIPISLAGKKFTVSAGLPLTDLNELPGAALGHQLSEWYQKGMSLTGPVPKDMVEYFDNHSFYFRDQLERDHSPLVAAPSYAAHLPKAIQRWAGVTPDLFDKRTGKKVLGWKGKADYVFSSIPGTPNYIKQFATQGSDRRGKGMAGKVPAYAGVKNVPIDPARNAVNLAAARQAEIAKRIVELGQQHIGTKWGHVTPEYRKLLDQQKILRQITYQGKAAQGYKVLPRSGGPPKGRGGGGVKLNGAGSSGVRLNGSGSGGVKLN